VAPATRGGADRRETSPGCTTGHEATGRVQSVASEGSPVFGSSGFAPTHQPSQSWWQSPGGHVPLAVFLSLLVDPFASQLRLPGGLTTDLQGGADLGPGAALVAGGQDQEPDRFVDAFLGVSRGRQVLQGPLGAGPGLLQVGDGSTEQPAGVGAGFGAHVNRGCHRGGVSVAELATTSIHADKGASNSEHLAFRNGPVGAPSGHTFLISSHISARGHHKGSAGQPKRSPDAAATARGMDASGVI